MLYTYQALKPDGSVVSAKGDFDGIGQLLEQLSAQDLVLIKYREHALPILEIVQEFLQPKVKRMEIVEFCDSMGSMLGSGLPLLETIETVREASDVKRLKTALDDVRMQIARGDSLSGAFARHPGVFPDMLIFFCSIGEETGSIPESLKDTAGYIRKVDTIISQVKRAFIYPAFVTAAMGAVCFFWLFYVLPRLVTTFKEMNVKLPEITLQIVNTVAFVEAYWLYILMLLTACIAGIAVLARLEKVRLILTQLVFRIPGVGALLKASTLTLFFSSMSLMLRAGLTLTKALEVLKNIFRNPLLLKVIATIQTQTSAGHSLTESFRQAAFFDVVTLKMISVGEKTGTLDQRLTYLADMYEEKTAKFVDLAGKMIEPVVIVLSGGLFVFIVVSLIAPMYDLMSQLGGG